MRIHFNKRAKKITVHHSSKCHLVDGVEINKPCRLVHRPEKAENPRAWIDVRGTLEIIEEGDRRMAVIS